MEYQTLTRGRIKFHTPHGTTSFRVTELGGHVRIMFDGMFVAAIRFRALRCGRPTERRELADYMAGYAEMPIGSDR
jgi:hypothetical protein